MTRVLNKYMHPRQELQELINSGHAVNIMRPSKWGNRWSHLPQSKGTILVSTREEAVEEYRKWFLHSPEAASLRQAAKFELAGKDLICCCAPLACHGYIIRDYLTALAA